MRALITGIGGFVGGHLATLLRQEGAEVWGIDCRPLSGHVADRGITMLLGDLCDREFARCAVRDAKPTHVFHLAWEFADNVARGADADRHNLEGLRLLLEAVHESAPAARVLVTSS
ncbi:MAG: NAD-dependent epimerase/dehydratase family protein, partial [Acidobacteriota bacterium]